MVMKKKVFLYAYDKINLGDDLFVHTIVKRYPQVQFYLWSGKENKRTFGALSNLKVIDQNSIFLKLIKKIRASLPKRYKAFYEKKCNAVVYIGGSIFIEYENWEQILNWWDYEAKNRPFYVLGANFGPYKNEEYRKRLSKIFEKMKDICFRDFYSYKKFTNNENVRCAPDILFSYPIPQIQTKKRQIFISVIDITVKDEGINHLSEYSGQYTSFLLEIINGYLRDGYEIVLSSFCKAEGDENEIERILKKMDLKQKEQIVVLNYDGINYDLILEKIAESESVIASRFHAFILGLVAHTKVYPVVYSEKTVNVMSDIGFQGGYADIRKLRSLNYKKVRSCLDNQMPFRVNDLSEVSQQHFAKLDEVFKK